MRSTMVWSAIVMLSVGLTSPVLAGEGHDDSHATKANARVGDAYPLAVDPVGGELLIDVEKPVVLIHEGRELRFVSEANAEQFKADPAKYLEKVDAMVVEQQASAYPLETCVVSGEKLDVMGKPVDYVYGNRLVRFCCPECKAKFNEEPGKYLEKINAAVIERDAANYPMTTCVISGEKLGEMGAAANFVIANRLVQFCCEHCVDEFEKNPAKYLNKLDEAKTSE